MYAASHYEQLKTIDSVCKTITPANLRQLQLTHKVFMPEIKKVFFNAPATIVFLGW